MIGLGGKDVAWPLGSRRLRFAALLLTGPVNVMSLIFISLLCKLRKMTCILEDHYEDE